MYYVFTERFINLIINHVVNYRSLDRIFYALSDPTRRSFVAQLRAETKRISDLEPVMPMSKVAVAKHVKVLVNCNLITIQKAGREKFCHLNVSELKQATDWMEQMTTFWEDRLDALEHYLEGEKNESK